MASWRITAIINFPIALTEASPPAPGSPFPQKLNFVTVRSLIFTSEKGIKSCRVMVLANKERKAFSWRKESVFEAD